MDHISIQVFRRSAASLFASRDLMIVYVLSPALNMAINGKGKTLKHSDVVVVNEGGSVSFDDVTDESLFVVFTLDGDELRKCFQGKRYEFICDSSEEFSSNYETLKTKLADVLVASFESDSYSYMKQRKAYYELVFFLIGHFANEVFYDRSNTREELIAYVEQHYVDDLSLKRASRDFGMNSQYFSKYFKRHVGTPYHEYVVQVRMQHARRQIEVGEKKIAQIAMDCGFANLTSFNGYFKKLYHQTPTDYRASLAKGVDERSAELYDVVLGSLRYRTDVMQQDLSIDVDALDRSSYLPFWNEVLNFGNLSHLDNADVIDQLTMVHSDLKCRFLRIELEAAPWENRGNYTFVKEATRFDKVYLMGFLPWIVIDYDKVSNGDALIAYMAELLSFFANRHSIQTVRQWRIELAYRGPFDNEHLSSLFALHRRLEATAIRFHMQSKPLGFAIPLGNREGLKRVYEYMEAHSSPIEMQTFVKDPFADYATGEDAIATREDKGDLHDALMTLRMIAGHYGQDVTRVYVVSSRDSVATYDAVEDSCWRGATLAKEFIRCFDMLSGYSIEEPFDIMEGGSHTRRLLYGGRGALTYHGVKKPIYHCSSMFSRVGEYMLGRNEQAIVFSNDIGNYSVVCHNAKPLGHRYYLRGEQVGAKDVESFFDDTSELSLHLRITHVEDGKYLIKTREISRDGGSVQDSFIKMTNDEDMQMHPNDVEYLRQISVPTITVSMVRVSQGTLEMDISLTANAFALVNIEKQY